MLVVRLASGRREGVAVGVLPLTETDGPGDPGREDGMLEDDNPVEERVLGSGRCCCAIYSIAASSLPPAPMHFDDGPAAKAD